MGCTPSVHVSQTGVVYNCREQQQQQQEDSPRPSETLLPANCASPGPPAPREDAQVGDGDGQGLHAARKGGLATDAKSGHVTGLRVRWSESETQAREDEESVEGELTFGPMVLQHKPMSVLLIFSREDRQSTGFWRAAERLGYSCTIAGTPDTALETYQTYQHNVIIMDARTEGGSFDAKTLCRSIKASPNSTFSVLIAVTNPSLGDEEEEAPIEPLLKAGFTRVYQQKCSVSACMNELQSVQQGEVRCRLQLQASSGIYQALDHVTEAVEVSDSQHRIQFVNHAYERLTGYSSEELLGKDSRDLQKSEKNRDLGEAMHSHTKKGKRWEGTYYTRRKSGDTIPFHCKVIPMAGPNGSVRQFVSVGSHHPDSYNQVANGSMMPFSRRRESMVRAHSMTIEAPITKVINIINAAQENSPLTVAQALDKVLEILQTSELYSPFQSQDMRPGNDPVALELVDGLMTQSVKRKLSGHDFQRSSQHGNLPNTPATSLSQVPESILKLLNDDNAWDFDIIALERATAKRPLLYLGLKIFTRFGACDYLGISEACLVNWLQLMEANYHSRNYYHNSTHAADVLHATAYFLDKERSKAIFDCQDQVSCLIAAAVHDVDHPARTNAFLINEKHQLAILYNDQAVLENHHASTCFRLTHQDKKADIFKNLSSDDYKTIRQSIIDQVLATDMKQHFEHLSKFTTSITNHIQKLEGDGTDVEPTDFDLSTVITDLASHENRTLIKRMMIKCADVSNPLRPLQLCKEWAYRIAEEYCQQTDEEKSRGLPVVMAQFDRKVLNIPKCQLAFVNLFITNMFDAWDDYCDVPELMQHLQLNYDYWKEQEQIKDGSESNAIESAGKS